MPKLVDHRERRHEIARVTSDIIAEAGVDAVTIRSIADRLNFSTGIVQHYFPNKREILLYTLRVEGLLSQRRLAAAVEHDPTDLVGLLASPLPLDESRSKSWKTFLAYWSTAALDSEIALEHRRLSEAVHTMIRHGLRANRNAKGLRTDIDDERVALRLYGFVRGIGIDAICHPDGWPAELQLALLVQEIRDVTGLDQSLQQHEELKRIARSQRKSAVNGAGMS